MKEVSMKQKNDKLDTQDRTLDLFSGTHEYYAKYRPAIPEEVINTIIDFSSLKPSDRVLDIGSGTGQVALAMEGKCREMVCLDPDLEMLKQAKRDTQGSKTNLVWINCSSRDLSLIKENLGVFKLATICRAFHWMDQEQVLKDLDDLIEKNGSLAIFGDGSFWTGHEPWQRAVKKVVQKYLGEKRRARKGLFQKSDEPWEKIISRSSFKHIKSQQLGFLREWNTQSILGWLFSSSFASTEHFGEKLDSFKKDIEQCLLATNPDDLFQENAVFSIILASREKH